MTTTTNHDGSITVSDMVKRQRIHIRYIGYDARQAKYLFKKAFHDNNKSNKNMGKA